MSDTYGELKRLMDAFGERAQQLGCTALAGFVVNNRWFTSTCGHDAETILLAELIKTGIVTEVIDANGRLR